MITFLNFQVILGSTLRTFWTMASLGTPFLKMYPAQRLAITYQPVTLRFT